MRKNQRPYVGLGVVDNGWAYGGGWLGILSHTCFMLDACLMHA